MQSVFTEEVVRTFNRIRRRVVHITASARSGENHDVVRFIPGDGGVTAVDVATGVASEGQTKADALVDLADALRLHEDGGEPIEDPDAFLAELGLEPMPEEPAEYPF